MVTTRTVLVFLTLGAALTACDRGRPTDSASQDDFRRDLQLAASSVDLAAPPVNPALLNSMETKPQGAPEKSTVVRRGTGTRAVRSPVPTVAAAPAEDVAAEEESQEVETVAEAPAPDPNPEPVAVAPRPAPPVILVGNDGGGDYGTGSGGVFGGGVYGGGRGGVVIRGGGVDGDNCELHRGRGGVVVSRGPVYVPNQPVYIPNRAPSTSRPGISSRSPRGSSTLGRAGAMSESRTSRPTLATRPRSR